MADGLQQIAKSLNQQRAWGKYRGFVTDNADPEKRARLKLRVPALLGEAETDWALPCLPCGGLSNQGFFSVPQVGAQLWVEFEGGQLDFPIWTGTFWQVQADIPPEVQDPPTTTVLRTPKGHTLLLEDKDDAEQLLLAHLGGAQLEMNKDGNLALTDQSGATLVLDTQNSKVVLEDANGNTLTLDQQGTRIEDANGNKIEMSASGVKLSTSAVITIEGSQVALGGSGGEPVIKGTSFLTLFATHVHPTAVGPSGPPIPQGEMSSLSTKVMSA
ncbi:MAG TPA: phage baseplate assembly protein V [Ideonella sp.]|uniref:phage baseplate assembly protein V n=1 Tax=Ideonella sp. TaxID=1929293 RepID=UPI002BCB965D|nr:phage baseplate assembly protein V [Ideonella sp.]HSI51435.1 phage baseplate assembly protein V [Ideonella sp.]